MIKAIIFDMDGVIVDTEPAHQMRMYRFLKQFNPSIREEELNVLVGRGSKECWEIASKLAGNGYHADALKDHFHQCWVPAYSEKIDYQTLFRTDMRDVLAYAHENNIKTAVASSTAYAKVKNTLEAVGIFTDMDVVMSGESCQRPKPSPDIYLEVAQRLGVSPQECLVIEDSTVGIEAAHQAGATVAALVDLRFPFDRSHADLEIESIAEIIRML